MIKINGIEYTEEMLKKMAERDVKAKERAKHHAERLRAKNKVIIRKAKEAGITVSNKEIDEELASMTKKK